MQKRLPSNVAWFEVLMYASLGLGVIVSTLQWSQSVERASAMGLGAGFVLFVQASVVAFIVLFIWLIARRQKNWARWIFLILGVLGLPFSLWSAWRLLLAGLATGTLMFVQLLMQAAAVLLIFTGNARDWFKRAVAGTPV